ncbi:MAG: beta strand repeat-containing protein [Leptospira bouyouniensis]
MRKVSLCAFLLLTNCIAFLDLNELRKSSSSLNYSLLALLSNSSTIGNSTTAIVGSSGGSVRSSDGSFVLEIPPGALTESKQITITKDAAPSGNVSDGFGKKTNVLKFEPEGLVFLKPAILTLFYQQGEMKEGGFEEKSTAFYYINNDSTLEKTKTVSIDLSQNKLVSEVKHFSFGMGLNIQVWLVNNGIISNPVPVLNIANNVILELNDFAIHGFANPAEYFRSEVATLGPFLIKLVSILGYDPISVAFPNEDFDGDGVPNSEDPYVLSTGSQILVISSGASVVSANNGAINSTQFIWKSSKSGNYTIRKGGNNCTSGTIVSSGTVSSEVHNTFGPVVAATDLSLGSNTFRICVVSSSITSAIVQTFTRDDSIPTVSINPEGGNYGTPQNVSLTCSDTGGAGCSAIAYTTNGTTPSFSSSCSITNGNLFTTPILTQDSNVTLINYRSCDHAGNVSQIYSNTYSVDSVLPSVTINSVLPGTVISGNINPQVNWQSNKDGNYKIVIGADCNAGVLATGTNVSGIATNGIAVNSVVNSGTQLLDGNRKINICVANLIGNIGTSSATILVDSMNPTLTVTPAGGVYSTPQTVTAICSDSLSGCQKIAYTTDGTDPAFDVSGSIVNGSLYIGTLTTPNHYRFIARDFAGNLSDIFKVNYSLPDSTPPTVSIQNLRNLGTVQSGFLVGNATDDTSVSLVEVSIDSGVYVAATGTNSWKFKLPFGLNTWRDSSLHTISVRSKDIAGNFSTISTITVRKGINKDFNGDGYSDVIVSAYSSNNQQGRVYIFHNSGSAGITENSLSSANTIIAGSVNNELLGYTVGTGDFNGDGYADAMIGAIGANLSKGKVYIFHSQGTSGIPSTNTIFADSVLSGEDSSDPIGTALASGDFNGDGYSDAILGAYNKSKAYIFLSSGNSGVSSRLTATADTKLTGVQTQGVSAYFGISISTADMNGDGFADAIIGASGYNSFQGQVYVFHSSGLSGIPSGTANSANATLTGEGNGNIFGRMVLVGDFNGDGKMDILANSIGANSYQGKAYVFHGTTNGIVSVGAASANSLILGEGGFFGYSGSVGDFNGDGYSDALIGANEFNSRQGKIYIFHGSASGITATSVSSANLTILGETVGSNFGEPTGVGDFNCDGFMDLIVGSWFYNSYQGRAYIFYSNGSEGIKINSANAASVIFTGNLANDRFGIVSQ